MRQFEKVKSFFDDGLWNLQRVKNAVVKGWITAEDFEIIVGFPYCE